MPEKALSRSATIIMLFIILVSAATVPGRLDRLRESWPLLARWADPDEQMRLILEDVPYDTLKTAAERLPADVTILLVTSGRDVRRLEYTLYHRALYLLAPRPVWWLSAAPPDGTWESRWWISAPLTAESIAAVAAEKSADCLLLFDVPLPAALGQPAALLDGTPLVQIGTQPCLADQPSPAAAYPVFAWPLRLTAALFVILMIGFAPLSLAARHGYQTEGVERLSLAWLIGAGLTSTALLWLNGLGLSLNRQLILLTTAALLLLFSSVKQIANLFCDLPNRATISRRATSFVARWPLRRLAWLLLVALLAFYFLYILLLGMGLPLTIWDSWVNWGSKGRLIFLENGLTPALYTDPSRAVMLLAYPLSIPLLEAWLYGWLGAADDRLVGIFFVLTYLALAGVLYSALRRQAFTRQAAFLVMAAVLSIGQIINLAAFAFTDLWLTALLVAAAVGLVEWFKRGRAGYLFIAAAAAGLLPWFKQEGLVLVLVLLVAAAVIFFLCRSAWNWPYGRLWALMGSVVLSTAVFAGPWRFFAAGEAAAVPVFVPLTLYNLLAHQERLPVILQVIYSQLITPGTAFVWPLAAAAFLWSLPTFRQHIRRPQTLFLLVPLFYLGLMSVPYLFSDFVPYEQHILSSFFRLNAQIMPLLVLWIAHR